jgi:MarR family transcriptional regulator, transcriptional regulator for hemolysin
MLPMPKGPNIMHHDPDKSLGFHGNLTGKAFLGALEKKLKGTGVSPVQFVALGQLITYGPMTQSQIARILSFSHVTGVRLADRMERDGWVRREIHPDDGRAKRLVPTQKAIKIWGKVSHFGRELLEEAYRGIDPSEVETVKRVLARARKNLGA